MFFFFFFIPLIIMGFGLFFFFLVGLGYSKNCTRFFSINPTVLLNRLPRYELHSYSTEQNTVFILHISCCHDILCIFLDFRNVNAFYRYFFRNFFGFVPRVSMILHNVTMVISRILEEFHVHIERLFVKSQYTFNAYSIIFQRTNAYNSGIRNAWTHGTL